MTALLCFGLSLRRGHGHPEVNPGQDVMFAMGLVHMTWKGKLKDLV